MVTPAVGLKALYTATEGKFDIDTVEIGIAGEYSKKKASRKVVELPTGGKTEILSFKKLTGDELKAAVTAFSASVKSAKKESAKKEA